MMAAETDYSVQGRAGAMLAIGGQAARIRAGGAVVSASEVFFHAKTKFGSVYFGIFSASSAQPGSKQASKHANKPASKQASKQASKSPRAQHEAIIEV